MSSINFHKFSYITGWFFLSLSLFLAFFVPGSQFYTSFAFGSWLLLDYADYKLNKTSILTFFYNHKHRKSFYFFFLISFLFCFIVDYLFGVKLFGIWEWKNYGLIEFIRMYLFMNASFVLGMYELYRVVKTLLKNILADKNLLHFRVSEEKRKFFYSSLLIIGSLFLLFPLIVFFIDITFLKAFIMLLVFVSMAFISDAVTYLTGGVPILGNVFRIDLQKITALALTILIAVIFTEGLNLFGKEWEYLQMPFNYVHIFNVPLAVVVGWIPLVIGSISIVNMIKHLNYKMTLK